MSYFGKPRIFGEPLGLLLMRGGGAQTLAQRILALDPLWYLEFTEAGGAAIAKNAAWTTYSEDNPGPELLTDPGFDVWGSDNPTHYTVTGESGSDPQVTQRDSGDLNADGAGTGSANLFSSATNFQPRLHEVVLSRGRTYQLQTLCSAFGAGLFRLRDNQDGIVLDFNTTGLKSVVGISADTNAQIMGRNTPPNNATFDSMSAKQTGQLDARLTAVTLEQTGIQGAQHAGLFNGSTSRAELYEASQNGLINFTVWLTVNLNSIANGDIILKKTDEIEVALNTGGTITVTVHYSSTDAITATTTTLDTSTWYELAIVHDATTKLTSIYISGDEAAYDGTPQAGVGTRVSNTNSVFIGDPAGSVSLDALVDNASMIPTAVTEANLPFFLT